MDQATDFAQADSARGVSETTRLPWPRVRHVALVLDPQSVRGVHAAIVKRLAAQDVRISLKLSPAAQAIPTAVMPLLRLERLLTRGTGELGEPRTIEQLNLPLATSSGDTDLTIDLSGCVASSGNMLRVLYDGVTGETALMGALFAGRMPTIELADAGTGRIVARGIPCADNAGTIHGGLEAVLARLVTLIDLTVRGWGTLSEPPRRAGQPARARDLAVFEAKALAHAAIRRIYHLCCYAPHWRVCWRFVDGPDLWDTASLAGTAWNVIADPGFRFYADPFPFNHQDRNWVFVEDLDHRTNKGIISVVPFDGRGPSGPARPVLEEAWHLSYPFVFERDGQVWMIPESSANRKVTLYRAERFPDRWIPEADLLSNIAASDATIVQHQGRLWMFAATRDDAGSWSDTLSIFSAEKLLGPWLPHPANPIMIDGGSARSAGQFVHRNGTLWRPVQDCSGGYGTGIGLAEVLQLDLESYAQKLHTVVRPPSDWPGRRLHTLNRSGMLECVDGAAHSPRSRSLARRLQQRSGRREDIPSAFARA